MKITVIAVGQKLPDWAEAACGDYLKRFPKDWAVDVKALKAEDRTTKTTDKVMQAEAARIRRAIPKGAAVVVLDEHGKDLTSVGLARELQKWNDLSLHVAFIIGGADGIEPELKDSARLKLRLSSFTLPHALARVVILEQLYRGWSLLHNHPYHRA